MSTILEVLTNHPNYKGMQWIWNDSSIDPQSQTELDQTLPNGDKLFVWLDQTRTAAPPYAEMAALRLETDQIMQDNQSGDTTNDRDQWLDRAGSAEGVDEGFRRGEFYVDELRKALVEIIKEIRKMPGHETFNVIVDPRREQRWEKLRDQLIKFDPDPPA